MRLTPQRICAEVLADRYAGSGEQSMAQVYIRVARSLAMAEPPGERDRIAAQFLRNLRLGAMGAGRIMANAGTASHTTMVNCFVQPVLCGGQTMEAFETALAQAGVTLIMGGGVGYDFSSLPPMAAGDEGVPPAVCQAIDRYDEACSRLLFQGSRRGAQMAVLSCAHPDILDFVRTKHGRARWRTFNVSVAVTDAFMRAVQHDEIWPLVHSARPGAGAIVAGAAPHSDGRWCYRVARAREIWAEICRQTRHSSEPGLLYIDTINRENNLRALESIHATNPCGEQPLPDYGACVLGPINLTRLVKNPFGLAGEPEIDLARLGSMTRIQVRMLDNVIDLTRWPLPEQAREAHSKRRIGIGITGLADMLTMLRLRYDGDPGRSVAVQVARCIRDYAYAASAELAAERGAFPLYRQQDYLAPGSIGDALPVTVRQAIQAHGLRNSHLVSFAPTGSVSLAFADNCSNGVEPAYDREFRRRFRVKDGPAVEMLVENHAWRLWKRLSPESTPLPDYFLYAADISPEDHIAMLAALQPYVDASISKTVLLPADCQAERVGALFMQGWQAGLKGLTMFRPDPALDEVLSPASGPAQGCGACC